MSKPGTTVHLEVFRDGKEFALPVTLGELPSKPESAGGEAAASAGALQGLSVDTLTPDIARQLQLPASTKGVVVTSVGDISPARQADLQRGDVIQEVNRQPVATAGEFEQAVRAAGNQPVLLLVDRGGSTMYVVLKPR
ncbi:MAG: PDZ domain-containing protein [Acidobacteria bacterium]|nr:PDZ domain-containing protein [Acidobacteriota bacterium]